MVYPTDIKGGLLDDVGFAPADLASMNRAKSVKRRKLILFSLCTVVACYAYSSYVVSQFTSLQAPASRCVSDWAGHDISPEAVWEKIEPGTVDRLPWTPCYVGSTPARFCAKLTVPLDYAHPEGESAVIALIKIPAAVPPADETYKGPILFNPGGPGGSGVDLINKAGGLFQQLIGTEFDIVGFDPRGVARTRPQFVIFPDEAEGAQFRLQALANPLWNTSVDAASRMHGLSKIINSIIDAREPVKHASSYVSTALVARDMLSITHAFGREKLQYWGFSYGTILGATFAAMFPDKVERLIIDGVVDADDYYTTSWKKNLIDTDDELHLVFQACVDSGPEKCALYESTAEKIHARLTKILEDLKRNPIAVPTNNSIGPTVDYGIVDYKSVKSLLFLFLYGPYSGLAPLLMSAFRALEEGKGEPFWTLVAPLQPALSCSCKPSAPTIATPEAIIAIACSDGLPVTDTVEELETVFYDLRKQSEFADVWAIRPLCIGWSSRPVERFAGPWVANTSHPLLLIGNTADPVTPVVNAHTMSKGFSGSVVLTQESGGHCSIAAPSLCTAKAIREYFRDGTLPAEGTVCDATGNMFGDVGAEALNGLVGEDLTIMDTWITLNEEFSSSRNGLPLSVWHGI